MLASAGVGPAELVEQGGRGRSTAAEKFVLSSPESRRHRPRWLRTGLPERVAGGMPGSSPTCMNLIHTSAALGLLAVSATAQFQLVIPANVDAVTEGNSSTAYPFDRDSATPSSNDLRVQYIYDSANFASVTQPMLINQLRFRANATTSSWTGGTFAQCDIRMGATPVDYAAMTNSFAGNWGGTEPAPVFSGAVTIVPGTGNGTGTPAPWYVTVSLPTPVLFDPTGGADLMIDIAHDGTFSGATTGAFSHDGQNTGSLARRVYNITDWTSPTATTVATSDFGITVELDYAPPTGTYPNFTVDKTDIGPGETVTFTDTTFSSSGVVAWNWDFDNDGNVDSNQQNPSVPYPACGTFDVKLEVLDNAGATPSIVKTGLITVGPPAADFTFVVTGTQPPFTVQLTDTSTKAPTAWSWDFDNDGNVDSTMQNPSFQIPARGVQTCSLTVGNACGTNQVTLDIDTRLLLCTQFGGVAGWSSGGAFYMDVNVANPAGITIESLGVQIQSAGIAGSINVYIKPGAHGGNETDRNAWSLVASGSYASSTGTPNETVVDVTDFSLAPGQWAMAIEYLMGTSTERFNYTTSGTTNASNADLSLSNGSMYAPAFVGTTSFNGRNWNGCVYYAIGQNAGSFSVFGDGCPGSNGETMSIGLVGGVPTLNSMLTIETTGGVASNPIAGINFGFTTIPGGTDLSVIGMPGCVQWITPDLAFTTPLDAAGTGSFSFMIPNDVNLLGGHFYVQPVAADLSVNATGATVGDAGDGTIGM